MSPYNIPAMNRFRTLARADTPSFSEYYGRKTGNESYKYAKNHSIAYNNTTNPNFFMRIIKKMPEDYDEPCSKAIVNYRDYATFINLSKTANMLDPNCKTCADVPVNMNDGLQSELYHDEIFKKNCSIGVENRTGIDFNRCHCIKCLKIPFINICQEKTGKIFPYGHFNNTLKNPISKIHSVRNVELCEDKLDCNTYKFCRCPAATQDCKCCKYTVNTPFDKTTIKYTENAADSHCAVVDESLHRITNEHLKEIRRLEHEQMVKNKQLANEAVAIYSIYGSTTDIIDTNRQYKVL